MEAFPSFQRVLVVSILSVSSAVIGDFGYLFDNLPPMTNVTASVAAYVCLRVPTNKLYIRQLLAVDICYLSSSHPINYHLTYKQSHKPQKHTINIHAFDTLHQSISSLLGLHR
jgi:hypothetical protein